MLVVAAAASAGRAQACDCPFPLRLKTDEERRAYRLDQAEIVATLRVDRVEIPDARRGEPEVFGDAMVVKTIKGKLDRKIRIQTSGGNEGGLRSRHFSLSGGVSAKVADRCAHQGAPNEEYVLDRELWIL
ncbi:hypothetical protein ACFQWF_11245 [Methylorubrum suomiense]